MTLYINDLLSTDQNLNSKEQALSNKIFPKTYGEKKATESHILVTSNV